MTKLDEQKYSEQEYENSVKKLDLKFRNLQRKDLELILLDIKLVQLFNLDRPRLDKLFIEKYSEWRSNDEFNIVLFNKDPTKFKFVEDEYLSKVENLQIENGSLLLNKYKSDIILNSTESNKSNNQK